MTACSDRRKPVKIIGAAAGTSTSLTKRHLPVPSMRAASMMGGSIALHAGEGVDDGRHERGEEDHHDLGGVAEAQPEDRQRNPGQRRNRADHAERPD